MTRTIRILAVPLVCVLAIAGCGGTDNGNDGIASAGGATASPAGSNTPGQKLSDDERRLKFAECMRGQGIDMPDPGQGGRGSLARLGENVDPKKAEAALQQCKEYAPNGGEPLQLDTEQLAQMREFAKCMRTNGVPNFPDPDADGRIRLDKYRDLDRSDPSFKTAIEKCRQLAPNRGNGKAR